MIKVVNVVQDFNTGGIQSVLISLLRSFKNDPDIDYSVVVLEKNRGSGFDKIAANEKLSVDYLGCSVPEIRNPYIRKLFRDISYDGRLLCYLLKQKPDVVHTHNTRMLTLILKCIRWTKRRFVWVHTLHSDPYAVHEGHIPRIQTAVNEYGVNAVCLNETQFKRASERYGIKNCDYVFNMVQLDKFHDTLKNRKNCRDKLGIPQDAYVIGTVGRLDPVKNYRFLLHIFSIVPKIKPNAVLVFTGDGEEAEILHDDADRLGILDRVFFLGIRNNTEEIYPSFDVFVSTSITEASSLVILEAQATGLFCVVSSACPIESIITDRVVRMSAESDDNEWVEQLLDPTNFAIPCASEFDYSESRVKQSLKDLYRKLIENRNAQE